MDDEKKIPLKDVTVEKKKPSLLKIAVSNVKVNVDSSKIGEAVGERVGAAVKLGVKGMIDGLLKKE